ncbi:hypothetical protein HNP46_004179 [Pseudomonas nitritireducens]|uniref:Uncharacterized protein n=1 Tax=Pseudomonas nitroreducens TaxID=46680 RepID=A0A7W7P1X3_PSENT|nr:hypothetical protein [Pseudomonas nitritireducens]MBB4865298.1 hypothetical protein [Pseudomonas nitritireducens]
MTTPLDVSSNQLDWLMHTLGLNYQDEPFRNHYVISSGDADEPEMDKLVEMGLMIKRPAPKFCADDQIAYYATEAGKAYAIEHKPKPVLAKLNNWQKYLHDECSCMFVEYLGINLPVYETQFGKGFRMVRKRNYFEVEVAGEWAATRQEAKASYKLKLREFNNARRAENKRFMAH